MTNQAQAPTVAPSGADGITRFASKVVELLASRGGGDAPGPRADLLALLIDGVVTGTSDALEACLGEFRRQRVSVASLADVYIPDAAREMGERWMDDTMSFADVSRGVSRLQVVLREIGGAWTADAGRTRDGGSVLLAVPQGEQHTLGPMLAMGQLRRMGVSVCLRIAPSAAELLSLMQARAFDGVFISISTRNQLAAARVLVDMIRAAAPARLPIVVGGAVLSLTHEAQSLTGADLATCDLNEALAACDLTSTFECQRKTA